MRQRLRNQFFFSAKFLFILAVLLATCTPRIRPIESIPTVDRAATDETKALFINLWTLGRTNHTLFGHQDTTLIGVGWIGEPGRSDVLEVTGQYPAVCGWEIGGIGTGSATSVDGPTFGDIRREIITAYQRGGVNTISWHMFNPVTGGNFYDLEGNAAFTILPGLSHHDVFLEYLDRVADFLLSLRSPPTPWNPEEHLVPVIFRPFHKHNGSWFWWGGSNSTEPIYKSTFQFIVAYLRDERGVHNLLYAYSPDTRGLPIGRTIDIFPEDHDAFRRAYFYGYPGDDYVDIFGMENYAHVEIRSQPHFQKSLELLTAFAHSRAEMKITALTESGHIRRPAVDWWTNFFELSVRNARITGQGQVAYALFWRNWDAEHYEVPFDPESAEGRNLAEMADGPIIDLQDDIGIDLYVWPPGR